MMTMQQHLKMQVITLDTCQKQIAQAVVAQSYAVPEANSGQQQLTVTNF